MRYYLLPELLREIFVTFVRQDACSLIWGEPKSFVIGVISSGDQLKNAQDRLPMKQNIIEL